MVPSCYWSFCWSKSTFAFNMFETFSKRNPFRDVQVWMQLKGSSWDLNWQNLQEESLIAVGFIFKRHERLLLVLFTYYFKVFRHPAITVHLAITVGMCIWNDGTVIFLDVIKRFSMNRGIGISHKNAVEQRSFWEFVWWIELASIEIHFWSIEFLQKPPTSLWPPFFSKPCWILKGWSHDFSWFFSLWVSGVNMNLRGSRCQILNETMKNVEQHAMSNPALYCVSLKRRRDSLQTCLILDILWYFLKFFSDFSVIKYWIPIKVLGLRFADLVLCPAFALQGLCRVLELHKRTDGLELGIWKISGDLGWTSVLISDIQWLCAWISGDWPWLAHGNHIPYHGNGSDPTGLRTILNSRVWKLWTTVSEEVRPVGQDDLCNTYKL